jgi:hypothetical protein
MIEIKVYVTFRFEGSAWEGDHSRIEGYVEDGIVDLATNLGALKVEMETK